MFSDRFRPDAKEISSRRPVEFGRHHPQVDQQAEGRRLDMGRDGEAVGELHQFEQSGDGKHSGR